MQTAIQVKRKNIDLPVDALQKLSHLAIEQGKSLKSYLESILISKANSINVELSENPSPSGDTWFDKPENMAAFKRGMEDVKQGRVYEMKENETLDSMLDRLGYGL